MPLASTVKPPAEPVVFEEITRRSVPSASLITAADTGEVAAPLIDDATSDSEAPALTSIDTDFTPAASGSVPEKIFSLPAENVVAPNLKPCWEDEARRSTLIVWPPMPVPAILATVTFVGSEDSTTWVWVHVPSAVDFSASAAVLSADSLLATSLRPSFLAEARSCRYSIVVSFWRESAISCVTIVFVSSPEASPDRAIPVLIVRLEVLSAHHVERLGRGDRLEDVPLEVADLDDHAAGVLVHLEVQLAVLLAQLLHAVGSGADGVADLLGRRSRHAELDRVDRCGRARRRGGDGTRGRRGGRERLEPGGGSDVVDAHGA